MTGSFEQLGTSDTKVSGRDISTSSLGLLNILAAVEKTGTFFLPGYLLRETTGWGINIGISPLGDFPVPSPVQPRRWMLPVRGKTLSSGGLGLDLPFVLFFGVVFFT